MKQTQKDADKRYKDNLERNGYTRTKVVVHKDDVDRLQRYALELRQQRQLNKQEG